LLKIHNTFHIHLSFRQKFRQSLRAVVIFLWSDDMLKSCGYCGQYHKRSYRCPKKPKRYKEPTTASKFRSTRIWSNKSKQIRARDLHLCQMCLLEGIYNFNQLEVHHIEPLCERFDLRLEDDNLVTLCSWHHKKADCKEIPKEFLQEIAIRRNKLYMSL
jgi:5-methylcytosine-specific restriction enzyme A